MRRAVLIFLCLCTLPAAALGGPNEKVADRVADEFNAAPRGVRGDHLLLPMSYLEWQGRSYGYQLPPRFQRLARDGETFRIRKLKKRDRAYRIEVESGSGARVKLWLYEPRNELSQELLDEVFPLMLADLFEFGTAPTTPRIVVNTASGQAHLGACNHLPAPELRLALDTAAGHILCPACFPTDPSLPYDAYASIRAAAVERARLYTQAFPPLADAAVQARVQDLGDRLVAVLPFTPRGYRYEFTVVKSGLMQAVSFPTGFVFITDKLLDAAEDEAELAAVLAHEIAHCELHLPPAPQFEPDAKTDMLYQAQVLQDRRLRERASDIVGVATVAAVMGEERAQRGAASILAKLQFAHEAVPAQKADTWDTHPSLAERMDLFTEDRFFVAPDRYRFEARDDEGDLLVSVRVLGGAHLDNDNQQIYLLIEATDTMNKTVKVSARSEHSMEEAGSLKSAAGKNKVLVSRDASVYIRPSAAVLAFFTLPWLEDEDYGVSTAEQAFTFDPSDLQELKIHRVPDQDQWVRVAAPANR
jgi:hypothetical protein